jgi:poly(hydroxyalkanoate) depolymerase family esterase
MTDPDERRQAPLDAMFEATRLTSLGRLQESTALIQRTLAGLGARPPRASAADAAPAGTPALPPPSGGQGAASASEPSPSALSPERVRAAVEGVVRGLGRGVAPVLKGLEGLGLDNLAGGLARAPNPEGPAPRVPDPGPGGGFADGHFACAAGGRDYKLFVPSRAREPAPLVVMLHGCTQTPEDFAAGTGMNALAERDGVYVVYPGQSRRANGQRCWNWFEPGDQGREAGESAIIAGLTRAIIAEHPIDPARIYIAGLSAGGAAAANVARAYPDLYAAVGIHSGLAAGCARDLTSALMAMRSGAAGSEVSGPARAEGVRVPTIVFHGDEDGTVSARNADLVLAQAGAAGLDAAHEHVASDGHPYTRTRYRDRSGRVLVEDWRVRGAGHAWSGGSPRGSYTDPRGPDASRAMLDFFAQHRLPRRD